MRPLRTDPFTAFNFLVEIEGVVVAGFSEVTGLQVETEVLEYREGGQNQFVHKLAGPTRYPSNLVLRRGMTDSDGLWRWHQDVAHGIVERKNGTIYLLNQVGAPVASWNIRGAYPVKWSGPDLRAESSTVAVETVDLVHQGITRA